MSDHVRWAILELMGHRQRAGRLSEVSFAGVMLARIEIPDVDGDGFQVEDYGGAAIYGITSCSEEQARQAAGWMRPRGATLPADPWSGEDAVQTFRCTGCDRDVPWSQGADDATPDLCDTCAAEEEEIPGGAELADLLDGVLDEADEREAEHRAEEPAPL